jgi:chemotaxis protein CheD
MSTSSAAPAEVYLFPGESHFARRPTIIRTLLGSCVGATFWSARLGAGGMCHALLPRQPETAGGISVAIGRRFADYAIRELAHRFQTLGAARGEVQVKLFGGADVLAMSPPDSGRRRSIGEQNCEAALATLAAEGLEVVASCVRGTVGYDIRLDTRTGDVMVRRLSNALNQAIDAIDSWGRKTGIAGGTAGGER